MTDTSREFHVPDISCDHCVRAIEGGVRPIPGVEDVEVDVESRTVTVRGGDPVAVEAAIVDAGYTIA